MKTFLLALLLGFSFAGAARAQDGSATENDEGYAAIPPSVEAYAQTLAKGNAVPVDTLFRTGLHAADDLAGPKGVLDDLSDPDYETVVAKMKGFRVNRNEVSFAEPDPAFFLDLARAQKDSVSIEFFVDYQQTVPGPGILPGWFRPMTDYSGCVDFGTLALVQAYARWKAFHIAHPHRYGAQVEAFRRKIETVLTLGDCVCEDKDSVLKELKAFLDAQPNAQVAPKVRQRLQAIEGDQAHLRYHCNPS